MKVFMLDPGKCSGCRLCEMTCSFTKHKVFNRELSNIRIESNEDISFHVPIKCMQCEDSPCIKACFSRALHRDGETGAVLWDRDRCILCKACIVACPFGCVSLFSDGNTQQIGICDLCHGQPECVSVCRSGAISYKEGRNVNRAKRRDAFSRVAHLAFLEGE